MSKEHIEKMGGEWPLISPGNTVAGNIESSKIRVPEYRQMVKEISLKYESEIDKWLERGWFVKTMSTTGSGIVVIFERYD